MEVTTVAIGDLTATSRFKEWGIAPWMGNNYDYHSIYTITLAGPNGKRARFPFYDSISNSNWDVLPPRDLRGAVECILSDAWDYINAQDICDFAAEFGYTDCKEIRRAWKGCKSTAEKLYRIGLSDDDILTTSNQLREDD